ncbi:MAG: tRNA (5-methylaminomethyl-2-thiouridine)(34)-methyltransferase MnmD [Paludibacter sp.]
MQSELRITDDGSHTLFVPTIDECYHSTHGAVQESRHIFIEAALKQCAKSEIRVLEIGFGTGLNAFLTLVEAERSRKQIHYTSLEKYPVTVYKALLLNYPEEIDSKFRAVFERMHTSPWNEKVQINDNFSLTKIETDFTQYEFSEMYDVVYFDAFSPEKQPEMWTEERFKTLFLHCNNGAILTTYCAKGVVRRALQSAGFQVERLAGPPGKREILRGLKI